MRINLAITEWADAEEVERLFSITRGTLYNLAESGQIKSAFIRARLGSRKGVRLFNVQSIRELLEASTTRGINS
jgi:hypothetical protein